MLVVQGSDDDAVILEKSLSGFAKLIDAKVSPFTHTFELLNITDDDMLQKIRARIEQMANESSLGNQTACEETHEEASVLPKDKTNAVSSSQTQEEAADILKMIDDNNPAALERDAASVRV
jgi:hypothetical protein